MDDSSSLPEWLWIVIEKNKNEEKLFGQQDAEEGFKFIPAFFDQASGATCLPKLNKVEGAEYEVQAMRSAELIEVAKSNEYQLFMLDRNGKILETYSLGADA